LKKKVLTTSAAETKALGKKIGKFLAAGDVVALSGELGAGKTTFAKGLALGLGVRDEDEVASPTFTLIHEYAGREKIFHIDWYRLAKVEGPDRSFAEECFAANAVTIIEWPERGRVLLPSKYLSVQMEHRGGHKRLVRFYFRDPRMWRRVTAAEASAARSGETREHRGESRRQDPSPGERVITNAKNPHLR
jgi:tRNA threonylcarbamoyladenosine biosynthesis protein TsaE